MFRLFEFFGGKNSSPIFSTLLRARASSHPILLVGTIKPYNFYYKHFLLRPLLSEIFAGPFHREKMIEQGKTVLIRMAVVTRHCDTQKNSWNHWSPQTGCYYELHTKISSRYNESRSCRKTIFYFSPLGIEIPNKALQTVNKFITINIIFVQKALN